MISLITFNDLRIYYNNKFYSSGTYFSILLILNFFNTYLCTRSIPMFALIRYLSLCSSGTYLCDHPVPMLSSSNTYSFFIPIPIYMTVCVQYQFMRLCVSGTNILLQLCASGTRSIFAGLGVWTRLLSMGPRNFLAWTLFFHWIPWYISSLIHFMS